MNPPIAFPKLHLAQGKGVEKDDNFALTVIDNMIREYGVSLSWICVMPQPRGQQRETQKNLKEFFCRTDFQRFVNLTSGQVPGRGRGRMIGYWRSFGKAEHKAMRSTNRRLSWT